MILFIDDEIFFNESYIDALKSANYRVCFERDVNKALDFFRKRISEIHLVILDIMMDIPQKIPKNFILQNADNGFRTGIEVLRLLNEVPKGKSVPKIILTNVADEKLLSELSKSEEILGCYSKKEVNIDQLVTIVSRIVK